MKQALPAASELKVKRQLQLAPTSLITGESSYFTRKSMYGVCVRLFGFR